MDTRHVAAISGFSGEPAGRSGAIKIATGMGRIGEMARLDRTGRMHRGDNRNCQERLAESLVATLGREAAVQACRENLWDGVLAYVLSDKGASETGLTERRRRRAPDVEAP